MLEVENRTDQLARTEAELRRLDNTLDLLANDWKTGCITEVFYQRRKGKELEGREAALTRLHDLLSDYGARELSGLVTKIKKNTNDREIEAELKRIAADSPGTQWSNIISEMIQEERGSIVKISLHSSLAVARFLADSK